MKFIAPGAICMVLAVTAAASDGALYLEDSIGEVTLVPGLGPGPWTGAPCDKTDLESATLEVVSDRILVTLQLVNLSAWCPGEHPRPLYHFFSYDFNFEGPLWDFTKVEMDFNQDMSDPFAVASGFNYSSNGGGFLSVYFDPTVNLESNTIQFEIHPAIAVPPLTDGVVSTRMWNCAGKCWKSAISTYGDRIPDAGTFTFDPEGGP